MTFADLVYGVIVPFVDTYVIMLLYTLAFILFLWGAFRFFFSEGEEAREKGKKFVVWGLVGFFVIFSVWGIVNLLLGFLAF